MIQNINILGTCQLSVPAWSVPPRKRGVQPYTASRLKLQFGGQYAVEI